MGVIFSPGALHILGPGDPEHLHELGALAVGALAEAAAGQRHPPVLHAHRGVQGAQEGTEIPGAFQVHHGVEGLPKGKKKRRIQ